jgi:histidyl-tRNA synthetase
MIELSGASKDKFKQICSSIDKLDKEPWSEVERELIEEKGLSTSQAKILESFVQFRGNPLETLSKIEPIFCACPSGVSALSDLSLLFKYLEIFQISASCSLDLSLARGLDYYTGFILEIVSEGS